MSDNKKKKSKAKKPKVTYYDDGRTIADMSSTSKPAPLLGGRTNDRGRGKKRASAREQWNTYKSVVKQMILPMLVTIGILTVAFLIVYILMVVGSK